MNVLVACEFSGAVRDAFIAAGHNAWSCDLIPTERGNQHFVFDCLAIARASNWDLMIAHPPCTYLCSSGLHWNSRRPGRAALTDQAVEFVRALLEMEHIPRIAVENPVGCLSTRIRKPDQIIQPHYFGDDASKATCLWLKGLPCLTPTQHVPPRMVCCGQVIENGDKYGCPNCNGEKIARPRWANQTNSGQNRLGPDEDRAAERARTYPGIAAAMASQWGQASRLESYDVVNTDPVFPGECQTPYIKVGGKVASTPCRLNLKPGDRLIVERKQSFHPGNGAQ